MFSEDLIEQLTLEEKAALVAGTDFMYTNKVPRLDIPALRMSDGPHGLRVQTEGGDNGVTESLPATAFPTAATVASSWNPENSFKIGVAIGKEAHKYGIHVVLGPGANIKRNPTAGRNFEYFSEDPLLAGKMASAEAKGIQSQGVGVSVKHFALNNAENFRFMGNSIADMRAMREIYLKVFEIIVKEAAPAAIMCAYNKINGEYCSQNKWLLTDILRNEWGFKGLVMTDWGAMHDRIASLKAGLDLEMPGDTAICRKWIIDSVASGELPMEELDKAVKNVLELVKKYAVKLKDDCNFDENDAIACEVAKDSAVLLKNDGILPLSETEKFFVCGDLFEKMRYQGSGSSMINPTHLISPKAAFDAAGISYKFSRGYSENKTEPEQKYIDEAVALSEDTDKVLICAGLTDYAESEGCDRGSMRLPDNQTALINAFVKKGKKIVLILFGGSPIELPFEKDVSAILNMYLPGQSGGRACVDLLFGKANPSGRLAETWPLEYSDVPFGNVFSKSENEVYKDSIFVGYRYYTTAGKSVRYPFGYGLSYTKFKYSGMEAIDNGDRINISCNVTNCGERSGAEVVQLYVSKSTSKVFSPKREIKAFEKIYLAAGESISVELSVLKSDLKYFSIQDDSWILEDGRYEFQLCSDSYTVILSESINIEGTVAPSPDDALSAYYSADLDLIEDQLFEKMSGLKIPPLPPKKPITLESRFSYLSDAGIMGKILYSAVLSVARKQMKEAQKMPEGKERDNKIKGAHFMERVLNSNSLMSMTMCAGDRCPYNFAQGFMNLANGHLIKGLKCFCIKIKAPELPKNMR